MFTGPAWSAPKTIDSSNQEGETQLQSVSSQRTIASQPLPTCESDWRTGTLPNSQSSLLKADLDSRQSECRWFYQSLPDKQKLQTGFRLPEKSIRMVASVERRVRNFSYPSSSFRADATRAVSSAHKTLPGALIPSIGELNQKKQAPLQTESFKADLARSDRSYKAATLGSSSPFRAAPVLANLSANSLVAGTFHPSDWLLSQADSNQTDLDPELGVLRVRGQSAPPSSKTDFPPGQNQTAQDPSACDPELGCIPTRPWRPPPPPRPPFAYLLARVDYFRSSNVFSAIDPVDDGLLRPGLTLFVAPPLGPKTYLIASVNGNLIRYSTQSQIDYNELLADVGIFQQLSPTMFAKLGWNYQQLFIFRDKIIGLPAGTRFLSDHAVKLELSRRDQLNRKLSLSTFYQLRVGFAEPADRSRILNSLIASLNYDIQPVLQVGLDYQFTLAHFTQQEREDAYHQIGVRLTYTMFRNTQFNLFAGYSFGRSSDAMVDFNGLVFGVSLGTSIPLF